MLKTASSIAGKAATFTGVVRPSFITITVLDDSGKPISNLELDIAFEEDNETINASSDSQGIINIPTKTGKLVVKLLEKKQATGGQGASAP
jgi:hypothetical protein